MFGGAYFGKTYFGGTYFGPNVLVTVTVRKKPKEDSVSGADDEYDVRTKIVKKEVLTNQKQEIIEQLLREDEEIVSIIITAIDSGII